MRAINRERAARINAAINGYEQITGTDDNDPRSQIVDLLTDIQHYCDINGIDFDGCLETSSAHHFAETEGGE